MVRGGEGLGEAGDRFQRWGLVFAVAEGEGYVFFDSDGGAGNADGGQGGAVGVADGDQ